MRSTARARFDALHDRLGTAGLFVAVVALVLAMTSGALAAKSGGGLTKKQVKEVEKIAKKFQGTGPPGAKGDTGPAGAKGDAGAKGEKGDAGGPGTNGKSVIVTEIECEGLVGAEVKQEDAGTGVEICSGETGFTEHLPPGKTETGAWGLIYGGLEIGLAPISFAIPLAGELDSAHVKFASADAVDCPGTASIPKAKPGFLCVYGPVIGTLSGGSIEKAGATGNGATVSGAMLSGEGTPGLAATGTWAVTG